MKNTPYKAVIFDMDGTITDTESLWKKATLAVIENRGIKITPDQHNDLQKQFAGMGLHGTCKIIKETFQFPDTHEDLMKEKSTIACKLLEQEAKFFDGFIEFHLAIQKWNLKHAIATNADDQSLITAKRILSLENYFKEHIYNVSHVNNKAKPDPAVYLYAAQQLGIDPQHCIAIEDSKHGIQAAKNAGMFCIGYNSSRDHNQVKNADLIVNEYHEIDLENLLK